MVHSIENTNPKTFTNVRVFAGDKKPAADASYRNLLWENFPVDHSFDIGTKVQNKTKIGTIDSWGPFFRVSFDLMIHSLLEEGWTSLLAFRGLCCPQAYLDNKFGVIQFGNFVNNQYQKTSFRIELNHWYNIIIEQKSVNGKVI